MEMEPAPKIRAALALRTLKKTARNRAECDLLCRGQTKNVSAWLSRETYRHYQTLLVSHVIEVEKERDEAQTTCNQIQQQVDNLRSQLSELEGQLLSLSQGSHNSTPSETPSSSHDISDIEWGGDFLDLAIMPHADRVL